MDAPPIQYCRTDDGVNIAFWTLGEGPPLVQIQNPFVSKLDQEWEVPSCAGYSFTARRRKSFTNSGTSIVTFSFTLSRDSFPPVGAGRQPTGGDVLRSGAGRGVSWATAVPDTTNGGRLARRAIPRSFAAT